MKKPFSGPASRPTLQRQNQHANAPQKKSGGGILLGLFLGLVVGILIAFGVVWYLNKTPLPFMNKYEGSSKPASTPAQNGAVPAPGNTPATGTVPTQPLALPGKPGEKPSDKPRFDFYGILEGKTPAASSVPAPAAEPLKPAVAPVKEVMFLQVGAFQKAADADNLKAKLAMMGIEAGVQEVDLPEKGKMHRVRVGPLGTADEMNRVRTHLSQGGIQATVIKQKAE